MTAIVTDSVGNIGYFAHYQDNIIKAFQAGIKPDLIPQASLFFYSLRRQHDVTNCPVFSLQDIKEGFKHPEIFNQVSEWSCGGAKQIENGLSVSSFQYLPPSFMKTTQTPLLKDYLAEQNSLNLFIHGEEKMSEPEMEKILGSHVKASQQELQALNHSIFKHTVGKYNEFVKQRFRKYEAIILSTLLKDPGSLGS